MRKCLVCSQSITGPTNKVRCEECQKAHRRRYKQENFTDWRKKNRERFNSYHRTLAKEKTASRSELNSLRGSLVLLCYYLINKNKEN